MPDSFIHINPPINLPPSGSQRKKNLIINTDMNAADLLHRRVAFQFPFPFPFLKSEERHDGVRAPRDSRRRANRPAGRLLPRRHRWEREARRRRAGGSLLLSLAWFCLLLLLLVLSLILLLTSLLSLLILSASLFLLWKWLLSLILLALLLQLW